MNEFISVVEKKIVNQYSKEEIEEAFGYVEQEKDRITQEGLMKIFEELGEKISKAEISEMFRAVTNGD